MNVMLKEIGDIITGNTPSKNSKEFWRSKDICFIKPDIITDSGVHKVCESNEYISECARKKARIVSKDAIFITCIGSIGKVGIAGEGEYAFNQQINAIVPNEKVNPRYLAYNLLYNKPRLIDIANAPVVPIINKSQFGEFVISIEFDINKQSRIVDILDKLSSLIEKYNREMINLDKLVRARFVEMFGDIIINDRLWKTDNWSNVVKIVNGKNQKSVESNDGKYVICGSGGIMGRATDYLTKENSVIIGRKGNINKPILMREKYWNVDTAFGVEPNENYICVEYLYMFCLFFDFNRLNKVVTIPSLTKIDLLDISMPIPDLYTQKRFATFVHQVNKSKFTGYFTTSNPYIQNPNFAVKWS